MRFSPKGHNEKVYKQQTEENRPLTSCAALNGSLGNDMSPNIDAVIKGRTEQGVSAKVQVQSVFCNFP